MRFTRTLLLALTAVAVHSAVVPENTNTQAQAPANNQNANTQNANTQNANTQNTNTQNQAPQNNQNQLTPEAQCVISNNCNQDVACIARCYGVPAPTNDMVFQTNDCALKCPDPAVDNAGYLKCYNECVDNFYMGNNLGAGTAATTGTTQNGNAQNGNAQNGNAQNGNLQNGNLQNGNAQNGKLNPNGNLGSNNSTNSNGSIKLNNGNNGNLIQESGANTMTMSVLAITTAVLALLL